MPRLMSVAHTAEAVETRRKTMTRRLGWWEDKNGRRMVKPGDELVLCRKVMGRKKGEPLERLATVRVVAVRRERLWHITEADIARECVPVENFDEHYTDTGDPTPMAWVSWFCEAMDCMPDDFVTVIEWVYQPDSEARS